MFRSSSKQKKYEEILIAINQRVQEVEQLMVQVEKKGQVVLTTQKTMTELIEWRDRFALKLTDDREKLDMVQKELEQYYEKVPEQIHTKVQRAMKGELEKALHQKMQMIIQPMIDRVQKETQLLRKEITQLTTEIREMSQTQAKLGLQQQKMRQEYDQFQEQMFLATQTFQQEEEKRYQELVDSFRIERELIEDQHQKIRQAQESLLGELKGKTILLHEDQYQVQQEMKHLRHQLWEMAHVLSTAEQIIEAQDKIVASLPETTLFQVDDATFVLNASEIALSPVLTRLAKSDTPRISIDARVFRIIVRMLRGEPMETSTYLSDTVFQHHVKRLQLGHLFQARLAKKVPPAMSKSVSHLVENDPSELILL